MIDAPLMLWAGHTVHKRFAPFERAFRYGLVLIDINIDRLQDADHMSPLFSVNRPGVFSFYERDHGGQIKDESLRVWADGIFAQAGVILDGGMVRLVTFPRHLFYKFAPISLWFGYDPAGELRGIIYEVNNTFGDRHCYVAKTGEARSVHECEKTLHVSPFFDVSGRYRFTIARPDETLGLVVENIEQGARLHMATIKARAQEATTANFLRYALRNPLSSIGVPIGIHWEALLLWLRGAQYRRRPAPPVPEATVASTAISPETLKKGQAA